MIITNLSVKCDCARQATIDVNSQEPDDPPIVAKHQCFCGKKYAISVDNDGDAILASIEKVKHTPIDINDPEYS